MKIKIIALILLTAVASSFGQGPNVRVVNPPGSPVFTTAVQGAGAAVTGSDSTDLTNAATRGLYIGGAGAVKVDLISGATGVTFSGLAAGSILPVGVKRVYATGTTATGIIALY